LNIDGKGTAAPPIDELQNAVALRDRALAEAQLRADENAAETAVFAAPQRERRGCLTD
jgi:hypothetical protein